MKQTIDAARAAAGETSKLNNEAGIIPDPTIVSFFYSGHGASINGRTYAVVPGQPVSEWIDLNKFVELCACRQNI